MLYVCVSHYNLRLFCFKVSLLLLSVATSSTPITHTFVVLGFRAPTHMSGDPFPAFQCSTALEIGHLTSPVPRLLPANTVHSMLDAQQGRTCMGKNEAWPEEEDQQQPQPDWFKPNAARQGWHRISKSDTAC